MAHYLVTGGCGFIGSQLTRQLISQGHDVIVVDDLSNGTIIHPQSTFIKADITQFDRLSELFKGLDGCFHLAAKPTVSIDFKDWFTFHNTNLKGCYCGKCACGFRFLMRRIWKLKTTTTNRGTEH